MLDLNKSLLCTLSKTLKHVSTMSYKAQKRIRNSSQFSSTDLEGIGRKEWKIVPKNCGNGSAVREQGRPIVSVCVKK